MKLPKEAERQLASDESVLGVHSGNRVGGGTLVCTDRRVFIIKRGATLNKVVNVYSYDQVASVHVSYGSRFGPVIGSASMTVLQLSTPGVQERVDGSDAERVFAPNTVVFGAGKKQHALADAAAAQIRDGLARARGG